MALQTAGAITGNPGSPIPVVLGAVDDVDFDLRCLMDARHL